MQLTYLPSSNEGIEDTCLLSINKARGWGQAPFNGMARYSHSGLSGHAESTAVSICYLAVYNLQLIPLNEIYHNSLILFSAKSNRITHWLVMLGQLTLFRSVWEGQHLQLSNGRWGRSGKEKDLTCSLHKLFAENSWLIERAALAEEGIATPVSRIWTLEDTWGSKRAPSARTGKTRDLLRLSFSVSGNGGVMYLWQQGTTLPSEHPSKVLPPCNVQLAKWNYALDAAGAGPQEALNMREFQPVCTRIGLLPFV